MYINNLSQQHKIPLFFAFLITLLLSVFAIAPRPINAQTEITCSVTNIKMELSGGVEATTAKLADTWYQDGTPKKELIVTADTIGCKDQTVAIAIYDRDSGKILQPVPINSPSDVLDLDDPVAGTLTSGTIGSTRPALQATYEVGEDQCDSSPCQYIARAWPTSYPAEIADEGVYGKVSGTFEFKCQTSNGEKTCSDDPDNNPTQQPWVRTKTELVATTTGNTGQCDIIGVNFAQLDGSEIPNPLNYDVFYSDSPQPQVKGVIKVSNCAGDVINFQVMETSGSPNSIVNTTVGSSAQITSSAPTTIEVIYTVGEDPQCLGSILGKDCHFEFQASPASASYTRVSTEIRFDCEGACNTTWSKGAINATTSVEGTCRIIGSNLSPSGSLSPAFDQENPAKVVGTADVQGCKDQDMLIFLTNNNRRIESTYRSFKIFESGEGRLRLEATLGEEGCEAISINIDGTAGPQCSIRLFIEGLGGTADSLTYNCDGSCNPTMAFGGVSLDWIDESGEVVPIELTSSVDVEAYRSSLEASPCYVAPGSPGYDANKDPYNVGHLRPGCYGLLAPLPGLTSVQTPVPGDPTITATSLAQYVNTVLQIVVGIAGLLAVVMIVIAGVQYMTSNVVGVKGAAKDRIVNALIGLLIALSIFIILNTLNPNLLNIDPDIQSVQTSVDPSVLDEPGFGVPKGQSLSLSCSSGINTVQLSACDANQMQTISAFGKSVQVHVGLIASVQRVSQQWENLGGQSYYPIDYIGGYACRDIAGTNRTSAHAFGMAIDINKDTNPHDTTPPIENTTDMNTVSPSFYSLWKSEGWGWGGDWTSSKDPMHFSRLSNEGGNQTIDGC